MSCPFKHLHAVDAAPSPTTVAANNDGGIVNKLVAFMQGCPDAAFLIDQEGKIIYRNKASQLMFLTNVHQMSICSLFSFPKSSGTDCWDDIAKSLTTSEPQHYDVVVLETDGTTRPFRMNMVKLPAESCGEANKDAFACAYVTPAHDHEKHKQMTRLVSISEDEVDGKGLGEDDEQLRSHMKDVVQASHDPMFSLYENGIIGLANEPAVALFGYTHAELVDKDIASICPLVVDIQNLLNFMNATSLNKQQVTTAVDKSGKELSIELGLSLNESFAGKDGQAVYFAHIKDLTALEEHKAEVEHKDNLCQVSFHSSTLLL